MLLIVIAKSFEYVTIMECVTINFQYRINCHIFTVLFKIKYLICTM